MTYYKVQSLFTVKKNLQSSKNIKVKAHSDEYHNESAQLKGRFYTPTLPKGFPRILKNWQICKESVRDEVYF